MFQNCAMDTLVPKLCREHSCSKTVPWTLLFQNCAMNTLVPKLYHETLVPNKLPLAIRFSKPCRKRSGSLKYSVETRILFHGKSGSPKSCHKTFRFLKTFHANTGPPNNVMDIQVPKATACALRFPKSRHVHSGCPEPGRSTLAAWFTNGHTSS